MINQAPKTMQEMLEDSCQSAVMSPLALDSYILVKHFRNHPLFIRSYSGPMVACKARKNLADKLIFSNCEAGAASEGESLQYHSHGDLYRISSSAFAKIDCFSLTIYAQSQAEAEENLQGMMKEYALTRVENKPVPHFYIINYNQMDGLKSLPVMLPDQEPISETDLELHYGDDFLPWNRGFIGKLSNRAHGISILRGSPGTGKTSYIRHLVATLAKTHRFLFLPLKQMTNILNNPGSVSFWVGQRAASPKHKLVVILEDAEHFLMPRGLDNAPDVSDLLNAGDGLLGDFLQIHLLCTVN